MASLFKQKKSTNWWIKYTVNGETIRRSLGTSNTKLAKEILYEYQYKESRGLLGTTSRLLVEEALPEYIRFKAATKTKKSADSDAGRLRRFFTETGIKRLDQVTPEAIEQFMTALIEKGRKPKTANEYRIVLSGLFNWAIRTKGWQPERARWSNPVTMVRPLRVSAPEIVYLSMTEIDEQLNAYADTPAWQAMLGTMILAGLRRSEVLWLTHDDVKLSAETPLLIVRAKTVDGVSWQPKTKRNRSVPISRRLHALLEQHAKTSSSNRWFFPSPEGVRWDPDNFSTHLRKLQAQRKLRWTALHFRHTFGSQLAQKGVSLYKIAELMGNSPEICRKHYAALRTEEMADIVEF